MINWLNKLVHGLLILCVGSIGTLTFFDAFTPEHGPHVYHLTLSHSSDHTHSPLPSPTHVSSQYISQAFTGQLIAPIQFAAHQNVNSVLAQFHQSGLSNGFLLAQFHLRLFPNSSLSWLALAHVLSEASAWLPPLEKPPALV